jgi:hypothetical protein
MKAQDLVLEEFPVKMRVDLRGRDGFMSQHFLHSAQISSAFNEMRRE